MDGKNVRQSLYIEFATAWPFGLLLRFVAKKRHSLGLLTSMADVGRVVVVRYHALCAFALTKTLI